MADKKLKKAIQEKVAASLASNLEEFKTDLSPKKLKRNIKKASKLLLNGLKATPAKKTAKKTATKAAAKKTAAKKDKPTKASEAPAAE